MQAGRQRKAQTYPKTGPALSRTGPLVRGLPLSRTGPAPFSNWARPFSNLPESATQELRGSQEEAACAQLIQQATRTRSQHILSYDPRMLTDLVLNALEPADSLFYLRPAGQQPSSRSRAGSLAARPIHLDMKETDAGYEIVAEVPGVPKENVRLELKDHVLTLGFESKKETESKGDKYHVSERYHGSFSRSIRLPRDAREEDVKASCEHGLLHIVIPKVPEVAPKTIAIN